MQRYKSIYESQTNYFGPDPEMERQAGRSEFNRQFLQFKNSDALKRALKKVFKTEKVSVSGRGLFTVSNISLEDLKTKLKSFNIFYSETFTRYRQISQTQFEVSNMDRSDFVNDLNLSR